MTTERIICIAIEGFAILAVLDSPDDFNQYPFLVAETDSKTSLTLAANDLALQDISLGMTVAQAAARCSGLRVLLKDRKREEQLSNRLVRLLQEVSPTVESNGAGCFYIDAPGLVRLYRGEQGIADTVRAVLYPTHLPVQIGIAGNKLTARIAALLDLEHTTTIVPPGTDRSFLAPLPITALPVAGDTKEKLLALGLEKISDIAALPSHEITRRFGDDVLALAKFVRGEDPTFLLPEPLQTTPSAATRFDYPLTTQDLLCREIKRLLDRLFAPLHAVGGGCRAVLLALSGERSPAMTLQCSTKNPTASVRLWMRQITTLLEQQRALGPVTDIDIVLKQVVSVNSEQLPLPATGVISRQPHTTENPQVRFILQQPSFLPERTYTLGDKPPAGAVSHNLSPPYYSERLIIGLRLFRPPQTVRVSIRAGKIIKLQTEPVAEQAGPWHLTGHWWDQSFNRWYFDIVTASGQWLLLYYDEQETRWYLQGVFD